ncbi:hypothetical protein ACMD2_04980 [Ananas comosus]|uniref:LITAF domain-containing protein n=1 Tax=Ananas comosus TaxID=4615 RepID=A0A199UQF8_ANACO|nr:hypothetical protein ACMD2_04980 [Ananas comosus]
MATKGVGGGGGGKGEEPAWGVPYYGYVPVASSAAAFHGRGAAAPPPSPPPPQPQPQPIFYVGESPYQSGMIPPNAVFGDAEAIPLHQTMFRDNPAPFNCIHCGASALSRVRSKPSLAAVVACMMPFMMGVCFLYPSMDCLWHKYHYCPSCGEKVAEFEKSDPCLVMDPTRWSEESFALPA